jgi:hypothetical protein
MKKYGMHLLFLFVCLQCRDAMYDTSVFAPKIALVKIFNLPYPYLTYSLYTFSSIKLTRVAWYATPL